MEFFIPGLLLFFVTICLTFLIVPKFTPLIVALVSMLLLTVGVYMHYKMFASEYRLSTWQESLKIYAPAIMTGAIILFIIYSILAFFTRGAVPVPSMPNITNSAPNTITNQVAESLTKAVNTIANTVTNVATNVTNTITNTASNVLKIGNNQNKSNQNKSNKSNLSRSFLETI